MHELPQTETITVFKNHPSKVLARMKEKPVLLVQNSRPAAVLVSPEQWDAAARQIADLQALVEALKAQQDADPNSWMTVAEFEQEFPSA